MTDFDQQLERLVARQEIVDVTLRYGLALDTHDWELLRTCFTADAVADFGPWGCAKGVEAIIGAAQPVMEGMDMTQHAMLNHLVELDASGDGASATCVLIAEHLLVTSARASTSTTRGNYRDRFVRADGIWRIAHRHLEVTWREGNVAIFDEAMRRFAARSAETTNDEGKGPR